MNILIPEENYLRFFKYLFFFCLKIRKLMSNIHIKIQPTSKILSLAYIARRLSRALSSVPSYNLDSR